MTRSSCPDRAFSRIRSTTTRPLPGCRRCRTGRSVRTTRCGQPDARRCVPRASSCRRPTTAAGSRPRCTGAPDCRCIRSRWRRGPAAPRRAGGPRQMHGPGGVDGEAGLGIRLRPFHVVPGRRVDETSGRARAPRAQRRPRREGSDSLLPPDQTTSSPSSATRARPSCPVAPAIRYLKCVRSASRGRSRAR